MNLLGSPNIEDLNSKLHADSLLLVERETGDILYERNAYKRMYPASTTKMLTAIIVLEKCDLEEIATVSETAVNSVPKSYTIAHLEKLRIEDLLYAMLIPSGNDAANVLAEHVSGSIPEFANLMNETARSLGLENSNFTNPSRTS